MTEGAEPAVMDGNTQALQIDEVQTGRHCMRGRPSRYTGFPQAENGLGLSLGESQGHVQADCRPARKALLAGFVELNIASLEKTTGRVAIEKIDVKVVAPVPGLPVIRGIDLVARGVWQVILAIDLSARRAAVARTAARILVWL